MYQLLEIDRAGASSRALLERFEANRTNVLLAAVALTGVPSEIVLATAGGFVQVVQPETGSFRLFLTHLEGLPLEAPLRCLGISPASYCLAGEQVCLVYSLAHGNSLLLANVESGGAMQLEPSFRSRPSALFADGDVTIAGDGCGDVVVWRHVLPLPVVHWQRASLHSAGITALTVTRQNLVAVAAANAQVKLVASATGETVASLLSESGSVPALLPLDPPALCGLAVCSAKGAICFWTPQRAAPAVSSVSTTSWLPTSTVIAFPVRCASIRNGFLVLGGTDGRVALYNATQPESGVPLLVCFDLGHAIVVATVTRDGHFLVVTAAGDVWRWPLADVLSATASAEPASQTQTDVEPSPQNAALAHVAGAVAGGGGADWDIAPEPLSAAPVPIAARFAAVGRADDASLGNLLARVVGEADEAHSDAVASRAAADTTDPMASAFAVPFTFDADADAFDAFDNLSEGGGGNSHSNEDDGVVVVQMDGEGCGDQTLDSNEADHRGAGDVAAGPDGSVISRAVPQKLPPDDDYSVPTPTDAALPGSRAGSQRPWGCGGGLTGAPHGLRSNSLPRTDDTASIATHNTGTDRGAAVAGDTNTFSGLRTVHPLLLAGRREGVDTVGVENVDASVGVGRSTRGDGASPPQRAPASAMVATDSGAAVESPSVGGTGRSVVAVVGSPQHAAVARGARVRSCAESAAAGVSSEGGHVAAGGGTRSRGCSPEPTLRVAVRGLRSGRRMDPRAARDVLDQAASAEAWRAAQSGGASSNGNPGLLGANNNRSGNGRVAHGALTVFGDGSVATDGTSRTSITILQDARAEAERATFDCAAFAREHQSEAEALRFQRPVPAVRYDPNVSVFASVSGDLVAQGNRSGRGRSPNNNSVGSRPQRDIENVVAVVPTNASGVGVSAAATASGGAVPSDGRRVPLDDLIAETHQRFTRRKDERYERQRALAGPSVDEHGCDDLLFPPAGKSVFFTPFRSKAIPPQPLLLPLPLPPTPPVF